MDNQTVGERIRMIRNLNQLSAKDFAEKMRVTQSYISKIEHDAEKPSKMFLHVVILMFKVSEHWLLTGQGEMSTHTDEILCSKGLPCEICIINKLKRIRAELEEVQKKMEIDRANSQSPEDDKTYKDKDILSSSIAFCNPEQDIENPSSRFEFTQLLKALREQKGVTQQQVSEATGISKSAYVNYECGNRDFHH